MRVRAPALVLSVLLCPFAAVAQLPRAAPSIFIRVGKVLDVTKGSYINNAGIWIEGDRIKEIGRAPDIQSHVPKNAQVIDLGRATVLPGLIDCHTHLMALHTGHARRLHPELGHEIASVSGS